MMQHFNMTMNTNETWNWTDLRAGETPTAVFTSPSSVVSPENTAASTDTTSLVTTSIVTTVSAVVSTAFAATNKSLPFHEDIWSSPGENANFSLLSNITNINGSNIANDLVKSPKSLLEVFLVWCLVGPLIILTTGGNLLVLVSYAMDRQLRTITNFFLMSLAVADLAIGLISMPFYTIYILLNDKWPFGPLVCDLWLSMDYTMSNASVANLLMICFDRYFSITDPLAYRSKRTWCRSAVMISCAWLVSVLLWPPWIFSWQYIVGKRTVPEDDCYIQFLAGAEMYSKVITVATAVGAFYIPVTLMVILYFRIYLVTRTRNRKLKNLQADRRKSVKIVRSSDRQAVSAENSMLANNLQHSAYPLTAIPLANHSANPAARPGSLKFLPTEHSHIKKSKSAHLRGLDFANQSATIKTPIQEVSVIPDPLENTETGNAAQLHLQPPEQEQSTCVRTRSHSTSACDGRLATAACLASKNISASGKRPTGSTSVVQADTASIRSTEAEEVSQAMDTSCVSSDGATLELRTPGMRKSSIQSFTEKFKRNAVIPVLQASTKSDSSRKLSERKQERKAARILICVLLAFIVTWTPYNTFTMLNIFCPNCGFVTPLVYSIGYWLCYINSTINPVIYALCSVQFRRNFAKILTCNFHGSQKRTRRAAVVQAAAIQAQHQQQAQHAKHPHQHPHKRLGPRSHIMYPRLPSTESSSQA